MQSTGPARPGASTSSVGKAPGTTNKLLSSKGRYAPTALKCKTCGSNTQQDRATYCQCESASSVRLAAIGMLVLLLLLLTRRCAACAYKRGICAICGKMVMDTKVRAALCLSHHSLTAAVQMHKMSS